MPRYTVSMIALESGEHLVHRDDRDCSLSSLEDNRLELGALFDDDEAIRAAELNFDKIDGCPECMPENSHSSDANSINAAVAAVITVSNM